MYFHRKGWDSDPRFRNTAKKRAEELHVSVEYVFTSLHRADVGGGGDGKHPPSSCAMDWVDTVGS
jgi:hypothetical protein